jgi:hypothetical protein
VSDEGQRLGEDALARGERSDAIENAERRVVGHRGELEDGERAALVVPQREVGERTADIDSDRSHHASFAFVARL